MELYWFAFYVFAYFDINKSCDVKEEETSFRTPILNIGLNNWKNGTTNSQKMDLSSITALGSYI